MSKIKLCNLLPTNVKTEGLKGLMTQLRSYLKQSLKFSLGLKSNLNVLSLKPSCFNVIFNMELSEVRQ